MHVTSFWRSRAASTQYSCWNLWSWHLIIFVSPHGFRESELPPPIQLLYQRWARLHVFDGLFFRCICFDLSTKHASTLPAISIWVGFCFQGRWWWSRNCNGWLWSRGGDCNHLLDVSTFIFVLPNPMLRLMDFRAVIRALTLATALRSFELTSWQGTDERHALTSFLSPRAWPHGTLWVMQVHRVYLLTLARWCALEQASKHLPTTYYPLCTTQQEFRVKQ